MNRIAKSEWNGDHRTGQHSKAPVQSGVLLGILVNGILADRLLRYADQTHQSGGQRLPMDTYKTFSVGTGAPHGHESFLMFIQQPDRSLVRADRVKGPFQDA